MMHFRLEGLKIQTTSQVPTAGGVAAEVVFPPLKK